MRRRGRAFIIGIGIMMAAAALSGCGKKAEEARELITKECPDVRIQVLTEVEVMCDSD